MRVESALLLSTVSSAPPSSTSSTPRLTCDTSSSASRTIPSTVSRSCCRGMSLSTGSPRTASPRSRQDGTDRTLTEFVATTGYHQKSAIRVLNGQPATKQRQTRNRRSLYDEATRAALIVLWEASDRVCGKRLRALLPILLPALERNGHLKLDEPMRQKILAMSASTIDRLLRVPRNATHLKKRRRAVPEAKRVLDPLLSQPWDRIYPLSALPQERPSLDRAEKRRSRAQAPGLQPFPR